MDNKTPQSDGSREHLAHTPGPWRIEPESLGVGAWEVWTDAAHSVSICSRAPWTKRAAESEANARLIAAAPDLLEACKKALPHHQGGHSVVGHALKAAIAKASPLSSDGSPNKKEEMPNGEQEAATVTTVQGLEAALKALKEECNAYRLELHDYWKAIDDIYNASAEGRKLVKEHFGEYHGKYRRSLEDHLALSPNHEASGSGVEDVAKREDNPLYCENGCGGIVGFIPKGHPVIRYPHIKYAHWCKPCADADRMKQSTKGETK